MSVEAAATEYPNGVKLDKENPIRIAIVAGESSGDVLGARMIQAIRDANPDKYFQFEGVGGEAMLELGFDTLYPMERLAVMGLVEPLGRLPELLSMRRDLRRRWETQPPAFFVGVDAPDFNLGLADGLKAGGLRTAQLVSPTVWAWRPKRVHRVARAVDLLLCLFPFESAYYEGLPLQTRYVGHPMIKDMQRVPPRDVSRRQLGLHGEGELIALLPGSREREVALLAPTMIAAGKLLCSRNPTRRLVLPAANAARKAQCEAMLRDLDATENVTLVDGNARDVMSASDAVVVASGTASLEAMILQRPMAIAYRVAPLSWALMSRLAVTPYVGLPNILAGAPIVPELLQDQLSAPDLALAAETLLHEGQAQVTALARARDRLAQDFDQALGAAFAAWI